MKTKKRLFILPMIILAIVLLALAGLFLYLHVADWGFSRPVPFVQQLNRLRTVHMAECWLGVQEGSEEHEQILDIYNSHEPLAQGYTVTATDSWCAAFGSSVAIESGIADLVPTECGCERQIGLWKALGRWEEDDNYMPLPGDYIYYAWGERFSFGDCTGWADHVGIVVGTAGPFIKVIEGNKDDQVAYRIILRGNWQIRGYGLPDYASRK